MYPTVWKDLLYNEETETLLLENMETGDYCVTSPHLEDRTYPPNRQLMAVTRYITVISVVLEKLRNEK